MGGSVFGTFFSLLVRLEAQAECQDQPIPTNFQPTSNHNIRLLAYHATREEQFQSIKYQSIRTTTDIMQLKIKWCGKGTGDGRDPLPGL